MNLTILPRFDINVNLLQLFSTSQNPVKLGLGDRQLDFRYLVLKEKPVQPSLAVILSTPTSISPTLLTHAVVATKNLRISKQINMEFSVGYGSPYHVYRKGSTLENYGLFANMALEKKSLYGYHKHYLEGPFGGLALQLRNNYGFLLEYDSKNVNVGIYTKISKNWTIQAGILNAQQITFGSSYNFSLLKPAPKTRIQHQAKYLIAQPSGSVLGKTQRLGHQDKLRRNFENLSIDLSNASIYYEQRLYRNPYIGFQQVKSAYPDTTIESYVPLFQGIAIGRYKLKGKVEYEPISFEERSAAKAKNRFPFFRNNYKMDFWIQPYFAAVFGNFNKPIQSNTSVALQSQLYILPGMSFNFGILFPVFNDLDNRPRIVRPAPLFVNQFYAVGHHFFSASAGFFQNDQYGINLQYRLANLANPWSLGLETGLTGDYYYPKGGIYYDKADNLLLLADVSYRLSNPDLTFKLSGGRYLAGDTGARVDLFRQFSNVEIGFYATTTTNGSTIGFNFAIPIPPGKLLQGKHFRLRTSEQFSWEYTYTRGYKIGERYRLGYQLDQKLRQYHSYYLSRQHQLQGN